MTKSILSDKTFLEKVEKHLKTRNSGREVEYGISASPLLNIDFSCVKSEELGFAIFVSEGVPILHSNIKAGWGEYKEVRDTGYFILEDTGEYLLSHIEQLREICKARDMKLGYDETFFLVKEYHGIDLEDAISLVSDDVTHLVQDIAEIIQIKFGRVYSD